MVEWVGVMKENLGFGRMKVGDGKNKCLMEEGEESIVAIGMEKDFRMLITTGATLNELAGNKTWKKRKSERNCVIGGRRILQFNEKTLCCEGYYFLLQVHFVYFKSD